MAVDPNIKKKADDIRNKIYGKEVRESLASGLEAMSTDVVENTGRQDNVESQFQDVIENTTDKDVISAPEIIAARDGEPNLKARLDKENQEVTAQLAQNVDKNPIYLSDYGVSPDKTAPENTAAIKQALADAKTDSRPIIMPWVKNDEWIDIDERLSVSGPIKIMGYGVNSRLRQTTFPEPAIELLHPDASVEDLFISGSNFSASGYQVPYRGTQMQSYFAGIVCHSDRNKVRRIKVDNMVTGILFSAWNVEQDQVGVPIKDCLVDDLEVSNVTFGLVVQGVKDFYYNNIRGSYKLMSGVTTPPHLIYVDGTNGPNINVQGGTASTIDGVNGQAYQFKGVRGGSISKLVANNSSGVLNVMDCSDFIIDEVTSLDDTYANQSYASLYLQGSNDNVNVNKVIIKMKGNGKPVRIDDEVSNSKLNNLDIQSKHTTEPPTNDEYDVDIRGTNNTVENAKVKNVGTHKMGASVGIWHGTNNTIKYPKTSGNNHGIKIRRATGNHTVIYLESDIKETSQILTGGGVDTIIKEEKNTLGIAEQNRLLAFDRVMFGSPINTLYNTTSGHRWVIPRGTFNIGNGYIYSGSGSPGIANIDVGTSNIDFSAGVKYIDREGLSIRSTDHNNTLGVRLRHDIELAQIFKYDDGIYTALATAPYVAQIGRRYRYRVLVFGNKIDFYIDNVFIVSATLSDEDMVKFGNITTHGLFTNANIEGKYDNLEWRSIE